MERTHIYEELEKEISRRQNKPLRGLGTHLLDLDLALSAAKMIYYDSGQNSGEARRYIFLLMMACVFALEDHGLPSPEELERLPVREA